MVLEGHIIGNVDITDNKLDITDPMYGHDVWCRMNDVDIQPGNYYCIAYFGSKNQNEEDMKKDFDEYAHNYYPNFDEYKKDFIDDITHRIFMLTMVLCDTNGNPVNTSPEEWEQIGNIGVDAGLAGFIWNQNEMSPEDDDMYEKLEHVIHDDEAAPFYDEDTDTTVPHIFHLIDNYGFFSSSGFGDGLYDVYAIKRDDTNVALRIDF